MRNDVSEINWDADYDGNFANISLDLNQNGKTNHYDVKLDNEDLADILNVPSVNLPVHKRLSDDFKYINQPREQDHRRSRSLRRNLQLGEFEKNPSFYTHVSSPLQNEEILVPVSFNKKTLNRYTMTPKKHHKKLRTHITHRFYKRPVSSKRTKNRSRKPYKTHKKEEILTF
jgi:hypothetical protein